jgi:hypothetical protein
LEKNIERGEGLINKKEGKEGPKGKSTLSSSPLP